MTAARVPLLAALVAVLLAALAWFLLYEPRRSERAELEADAAELVREQQSLRLEIARLEEIEENEPEVRAALERHGEFIPLGVAQPSALRQLQRTADAAGVEITSTSFSDPVPVEEAPSTGVPGTALVSASLTMGLEGGFFQAADFLRRVEVDMPRAVLVQSVLMEESDDGFPDLAVTWSGELFAIAAVPEDEEEDEPPDDSEDAEEEEETP